MEHGNGNNLDDVGVDTTVMDLDKSSSLQDFGFDMGDDNLRGSSTEGNSDNSPTSYIRTSLTEYPDNFPIKAIDDWEFSNDGSDCGSLTHPGSEITSSKASEDKRMGYEEVSQVSYNEHDVSNAPGQATLGVEKISSSTCSGMDVDADLDSLESSDSELEELGNRELLRAKQHRVVIKMLKEKLMGCEGSILEIETQRVHRDG